MSEIYDPNMDFNIVDQSIPEDETETLSIDTSLAGLFAGFTSRGKHNKIIECRSPSVLESTFGDDFNNFDKYGQTNITAMGLARAKGRVFYCSLLPSDATTAHAVFGVTVTPAAAVPVYKRTDTVVSSDGTSVTTLGTGSFVLDSSGNKQQIMLKASSSDSEATVKATSTGVTLTLETRTLTSSQFDSNGAPSYTPAVIETTSGSGETAVTSKFYPLVTIYYYSTGKGGNNIAFKLSRDSSRDRKMSDGRRYAISFYELLTTGSYKKTMNDGEPYYFSFNPDAKYSTTSTVSEWLGDVFQNTDDSAEQYPVQMQVHDTMYTALITALAEFKDSSETNYDIDFINGLFKNGNASTKLVVSSTSIDTANTYVKLTGGTDGSIDVGTTVGGVTVTDEIAATKKKELLINFFNCDVDDDIFDQKIIDADILPDCNYDDDVKKVILANFSQYRPDIKLLMDLGTDDVATPNASINRFNELSSYVNSEYSFMASFGAHAGTLTDANVGSPYRVTYTYDYLLGMADNFNSANGAFQMRAGTNRGRVKYFKPDWVAKKNKTNTIEKLDDIGLNYIQYIDKARDMAYMSESSQYEVETSKLLSDRNALVIGRTMRICSGILIQFKFDEKSITDTMKDCKLALDEAISAASIPSTIKITTTLAQTKKDKKEENAHCYIDFEFPDYVKKFHVTLTAKRQSTEE